MRSFLVPFLMRVLLEPQPLLRLQRNTTRSLARASNPTDILHEHARPSSQLRLITFSSEGGLLLAAPSCSLPHCSVAFRKSVERRKEADMMRAEMEARAAAEPMRDLSLKDGERLNIKVNRAQDRPTRVISRA